jgi:hypothetical protein
MIRYGIIGFGLHAVRRLMPGFAMATNSEVTALSRRNLTKAQQSADEPLPLHPRSANDGSSRWNCKHSRWAEKNCGGH